MTKNDVQRLILEGRAEIMPPAICHAARKSGPKPARLTFYVHDDVVKRIANQVGDQRDIFVLVRIPAEAVRATEAGLVLPGVK